MLFDLPELCSEIGLSRVPDFSTLCKAERRLLNEEKTRLLLQQTIRASLPPRRMKDLIELAAIDGSGFESRHISEHYLKRQNLSGKKTWHQKHPKMGILIDTATHMILAIKTERGPRSDRSHLDKLLNDASKVARIKTLVADAGYDSESAHILARKVFGIRSLIPPLIGRPTAKPPSGFYRRLMTRRFDYALYGQRWQVETVFSMLKRLLRSALTARNYFSQCRELRLRALTLNIMILKRFF